MNFAFERFPDAVMVDGAAVPVNTDFRVCLRAIKALGDERLLPNEKLTVLVELMYPEPPKNTAAAVSQALKFLDLGEETDGGKAARVFSFDKDARFIYTAFRSSFNIDLNSVENLHWWAFKSMLFDLSEDCFFNTLVRLRSRKAKGKLTKDEKEFVRNNPDLIALDNNTPVREAVMDFISKIGRSGGNG